jgi:ABC-type ATPase involved in cell division
MTQSPATNSAAPALKVSSLVKSYRLGAEQIPVLQNLSLQVNFGSERARTRLRRSDIGIVFQFFNLIPTLTVRENIALPLQI